MRYTLSRKLLVRDWKIGDTIRKPEGTEDYYYTYYGVSSDNYVFLRDQYGELQVVKLGISFWMCFENDSLNARKNVKDYVSVKQKLSDSLPFMDHVGLDVAKVKIDFDLED